jgi:hypothetical protein
VELVRQWFSWFNIVWVCVGFGIDWWVVYIVKLDLFVGLYIEISVLRVLPKMLR